MNSEYSELRITGPAVRFCAMQLTYEDASRGKGGSIRQTPFLTTARTRGQAPQFVILNS